jgi:hypothetical protein
MAVSRLMRKLAARGYVEIIQPWSDQPAWFRVTAQGLRSLGLDWPEIPFSDTYEDLEARLRHDRYFKSHHQGFRPLDGFDHLEWDEKDS